MGMHVLALAGCFSSLLTGGVLLTWLYNSSCGGIVVTIVLVTRIHAPIEACFDAAGGRAGVWGA